ncbi:hypothetical protein ACFPT7_02250 [Acidicapsa dinghuensis]|uniref:Uncharacterized protein n=1 Tax=Acidicapsa dinghuensis TaxID=2218256 RepID=A0ABW1EBC4_9BACT|nr:hypothetical protein [Acidicapsa dinghuensis]
MLDRTLTVARIALALAGAFAFAAAGYEVLAARPIVRHVDGVLTRAEGLESKLNATAINLDNATKDWAAASKTQTQQVNAIGKQAQDTLASLGAASGQLQATLRTANAQLAGVGPLLASAKDAVDSVAPAVAQIGGTAQKLGTTEDSATAFLNELHAAAQNPELAAMVHNTASVTGSFAHMAQVTDKKWSLIMDPPPCAGKLCWLKRSWMDIQTLSTFAAHAGEATYWIEQAMH